MFSYFSVSAVVSIWLDPTVIECHDHGWFFSLATHALLFKYNFKGYVYMYVYSASHEILHKPWPTYNGKELFSHSIQGYILLYPDSWVLNELQYSYNENECHIAV